MEAVLGPEPSRESSFLHGLPPPHTVHSPPLPSHSTGTMTPAAPSPLPPPSPPQALPSVWPWASSTTWSSAGWSTEVWSRPQRWPSLSGGPTCLSTSPRQAGEGGGRQWHPKGHTSPQMYFTHLSPGLVEGLRVYLHRRVRLVPHPLHTSLPHYPPQVWCKGSGCIGTVVYGLYGSATLMFGMSNKVSDDQ